MSGESLKSIREEVTANFDANAYHAKDDYRILVAKLLHGTRRLDDSRDFLG